MERLKILRSGLNMSKMEGVGMIKEQNIRSSVDWADYERGELYIRDKNLSTLVKNSDFIETLFHTWLKKKPTRARDRVE